MTAQGSTTQFIRDASTLLFLFIFFSRTGFLSVKWRRRPFDVNGKLVVNLVDAAAAFLIVLIWLHFLHSLVDSYWPLRWLDWSMNFHRIILYNKLHQKKLLAIFKQTETETDDGQLSSVQSVVKQDVNDSNTISISWWVQCSRDTF